VLIYPVIEPHFETGSYLEFAQDHGLSRATMQWFWEQYMGDQTHGPFAVPSQADSHAGLPATHVITAEYDVLRDEGEAYAQKLSAAGVPMTAKRYDGNLHGFIHLAGMFDDGITATNDIANVLKTHLR
jgi:acetyl esterase